jgi:YVTN family beta-propeller protein
VLPERMLEPMRPSIPIHGTDPPTRPRRGGSAGARLACWPALVVVLLLAPSAAGLIHAARSSSTAPLARLAPPVGPWDPLIGDPALGVPRYHVSTAQLAPHPGPDYIAGTPVWLAYDSADQSFWVAVLGDSPSVPGSVDVVPASAPNTVSAAVPVGVDPFGVAVDNRSNEVFVSNTGSGNLTVINGSTDLPIGSIGVGVEPMGVAYDPADQEIFVANLGSDNVSVVQVSTLSVVATINVGSAPIGVAYDPATGDVFVADSASYAVSVLSAATNRVVATVTVGMGPYGVAVDNATDNIYVSNEGSSNVSVIQASSDAIVASIPVVVPGGALLQGLAYDGNTGEVWVGAGNSFLVLLNTTSESMAFVYSTDPAGVAYDPDNGAVCYTNTDNATFECMTSASTATTTVPVTFTESGLPYGTWWGVSVTDGPGLHTNGTQLTFNVCVWSYCIFASSYTFVIPPASGYLASSPVVRVIVSSVPVNVSVSFNAGPTEYPAWFNESGLAPGVGWSVDLNGSIQESTGATISFREPNGLYNFTIGHVANYFASPTLGSYRINSDQAWFNVTYSIITWGVYFGESGLPPTTPWYVNLTAGPPGFTLPTVGPSLTSSLVYFLANGSYSYTVATPDAAYLPPAAGSFLVQGTSPGSVSITFTAVVYAVSFLETGLPSGKNWSVNLSGVIQNSTGSRISFSEPSGTFPFSIGTLYGYLSAPSSGSIVVNGASPTPTTIAFTSTWTYTATFHETGLPIGTGWSVAIGSQFQSSVTGNVTLIEPNGTYSYVIQAVEGYTTTYSGQLTVRGVNQTVPVVFVAQTFPVIIVEFGLPNGTNWSVTVSNSTTGFSVVHSTNGSAIIFYLPNGTYAIFVSVPPGYTASVSSATFTVAGVHVSAPTVQVSPVGSNGPTSPSGASAIPPVYWIALGAMGAAIVLLVGFALWSRRRPPSATPPAP